MKTRRAKRLGFTMIELLVVSTIIVVLSGVGLVSFTGANKKARDGKRQATLEQVRSALELYRTDNGTYPVATSWAGMIGPLGSFLTNEVVDPKGYGYYYNSDGRTYYVCAYMERGGTDNCGNNCSAPGNCNFRLDSP